MIITSGFNIEGYRIINYLGHFSSQTVLGTGIFSGLNASFADLFGVTSSSYEEKLDLAKTVAINKLVQKASNFHADGIIALDVDYTTFSSDIIGVIAGGTAVKIEKIESDHYNIPIIINTYNMKLPFVMLEMNLTGEYSKPCITPILSVYVKLEQVPPIAFSGRIVCQNIFKESFDIGEVYFTQSNKIDDETYVYKSKIDTHILRDFDLIKTASIYVKKYVFGENVTRAYDIDTMKIDENILNKLPELRNRYGKDAVSNQIIGDETWVCYCGNENSIDVKECTNCHRRLGVFVINKSSGIHIETILADIKQLKTAKDILEYFMKDMQFEDEEPQLFNDLKSMVELERMYGNQKRGAIDKCEKYFKLEL